MDKPSAFAQALTADDLLGRRVIDATGDILGFVDGILIDPVAIEMIGITIDKGFFSPGITVGKDFISRIDTHAITLSIRPAYLVKGSAVYDRDGEYLGRVARVRVNPLTNAIERLRVRKNLLRSYRVSGDMIKHVNDSVFLKVSEQSLRVGSGRARGTATGPR